MTVHEIVVVDADEAKIAPMCAPLIALGGTDTFAVIRDDAHLERAGGHVRALTAAIKFVKQVLDKPCADVFAVHRALTAQRKDLCAPLETEKQRATAACVKYVDARDAAARLERDKIEADAQAEAEAANAEQVIALTEDGDTEAAKAVREAPVAVYVPPPVAVAKPVGVVLTKHWKGRVVKPGLVPRAHLTPNLVTIGKYARDWKDKAVMPGVEFYYE